jgi:hypothetical protein
MKAPVHNGLDLGHVTTRWTHLVLPSFKELWNPRDNHWTVRFLIQIWLCADTDGLKYMEWFRS